MMSCRWRPKRSRSVACPFRLSNTYSCSTLTIGRRRRSALSASRCRLHSFSLISSCLRASSHSVLDTTIGQSITTLRLLFCRSFCVSSPEQSVDSERGQTATGTNTRGNECHACHTSRTHGSSLLYMNVDRRHLESTRLAICQHSSPARRAVSHHALRARPAPRRSMAHRRRRRRRDELSGRG